jgi:hypothetical protein
MKARKLTEGKDLCLYNTRNIYMASTEAFKQSKESGKSRENCMANHVISEQELSTYSHGGEPNLLAEVPHLSQAEAQSNLNTIDHFLETRETPAQHALHSSYDQGTQYMRQGVKFINDGFHNAAGQASLPAVAVGSVLFGAAGFVAGSVIGATRAIIGPQEDKHVLDAVETNRIVELREQTQNRLRFFAKIPSRCAQDLEIKFDIDDRKDHDDSNPFSLCAKA